MSEKPVADADISELVQLCFVGLMGAYKEVEKVLKDFHDKNDKPSHGFLFIESLVHQPLYLEPEKSENTIWTFSPFPYRLARHSLFMIDEEIAQKDILIRLDASIFTRHMYNYWNKKRWRDRYFCDYLEFVSLNEIFIETPEYSDAFFAIVQEEKERAELDRTVKKK